MDLNISTSRFQFMTNIKLILSKQNLSSVFLYLGSSCQDTTHIYFMILSPIIISHLRDLHISIIHDIEGHYYETFAFIKYYSLNYHIKNLKNFHILKIKKNIIIPHIAILHGWIEIASLNNNNKIYKIL